MESLFWFRGTHKRNMNSNGYDDELGEDVLFSSSPRSILIFVSAYHFDFRDDFHRALCEFALSINRQTKGINATEPSPCVCVVIEQ